VENVGHQLGFILCLPVCIKGKGDGLALYWKGTIKVDLINFGLYHNDVSVPGEFGINRRLQKYFCV
jgi:hypothetical protein